MLRQKLDTKKLIFNISLALLSLIVFFAIYMLVTGRLTLGAYNKTWDGVSVALNFETGNGNYDNQADFRLYPCKGKMLLRL